MKYLSLLLSAAIIILSSCVSMKEPVFHGIDKVQMNKLEKGRSQVTLAIHYFNPNNKKARLKNAEGEAWMDSTYLGHFTVDEAVAIPANSNFTIPVKLEVEMKHLLKHSLSALTNEQVLITIKGKAKVGKGGFYKTIPLHYEGKQNLQELFK
ncbi:MAG: LEA type 2 family protein [Chitinophagaceae bacterium]|nr:LEA type 2 family protein [Chitinophagaceae bacterium]